jgi:pyruvate/2-oxoglutarate/acetoin dehydrogenase E1 component
MMPTQKPQQQDPSVGAASPSRVTLSQAYRQGLAEEMRADDRILVYGTDLFERGGHWGQVRGLGDEFGRDRVRNAPISESAMVAAGVGAAMNGLRPVVDLNFIDFALGAMDEIINQAAKIRYMWGSPMPLVIRGTNGVAGGGAQHNNSFESWFAHTPGLLVAMPSTPADTKGLIKSALRGEDPVIFLMHKQLAGLRGEIGGDDDLVPFGAGVVRRTGRDITIATYGVMVSRSVAAAELLAEEGVEVEVIDLRTVAPLDLEIVENSVARTRNLVVVTESPRHGGVGAEIAAALSESLFGQLDGPVLRVGAPHIPVPHSTPLLEAATPAVAEIVRAVRTRIGHQVG